MRARTFEEWSRIGKVPHLNSRSSVRNDRGEPLFFSDQVVNKGRGIYSITTTTVVRNYR